MKKKVYSKLATAVPIMCLLSTPIINPVTTFAATSTVNSTSIQGYLFDTKSGIRTPILLGQTSIQNRAENILIPTLPKNPYDPIPKEGTTSTESTLIGNIIYMKKYDKNTKEEVGYFLEKVQDSSGKEYVKGGLYDLKDPTNINKMQYTTIFSKDPINDGGLSGIITGMTNNEEISDTVSIIVRKVNLLPLFEETKIKRDTKFELIDSALPSVTNKYTFSQSVTTGISKSEVFSLSATIGYKISMEAGGGPVPAKTTHEFSTELSASYSNSITIESSETKTKTNEYSVTDPKYASTNYQHYATAAYQLKSTYTLLPSASLNKYLKEHEYVLSSESYKYADTTVIYLQTPGTEKLPTENKKN